jgi:hypothetical protein
MNFGICVIHQNHTEGAILEGRLSYLVSRLAGIVLGFAALDGLPANIKNTGIQVTDLLESTRGEINGLACNRWKDREIVNAGSNDICNIESS